MDSHIQPNSHPLISFSKFLNHQLHRLTTHITTQTHQFFAGTLISTSLPPPSPNRRHLFRPSLSSPFASVANSQHLFDIALSSDHVSKTLAGTSVYTVSNTNNEFVLISDPNNAAKSIGLLCFRREDAEAFLAQVQARRKEVQGKAKIVPISLDQVYMLKVEGIAFRFLPDPVQIKNALELKGDAKSAFDGVPVFQVGSCLLDFGFGSVLSGVVLGDEEIKYSCSTVCQSDLLVVKRKNKQYCPIYFRKEDLEKELSLRTSRGRGISQPIAVGSLEDVLKKMEQSEKNSGWDDLIFVPPGKSHSQHIQEIAKA